MRPPLNQVLLLPPQGSSVSCSCYASLSSMIFVLLHMDASKIHLFHLAYFKHFLKCYHITCIFWQLALCSRCYAQGSVPLIQVTLVHFFLPCYVLIVFHWVPVLLFIYSPSNGHLGCFLVFTITNTVALNIVYLPPCEMVALLERREEYSTRKKELSHQWALEEGKLTFIDPLSAWQLKYMSSQPGPGRSLMVGQPEKFWIYWPLMGQGTHPTFFSSCCSSLTLRCFGTLKAKTLESDCLYLFPWFITYRSYDLWQIIQTLWTSVPVSVKWNSTYPMKLLKGWNEITYGKH